MHYQVPQFIDVEDKIVGPFTLRQFLFIAAAFLINFFSFFVLKFFIWIIFVVVVSGIALAFAFVKYNGRHFSVLIRSAFNYFWKPRRYIWRRTDADRPPFKGDLEGINLKINTSSQLIKGEKSFRLPFLQKLRTMKQKYEVFRKITGEREIARRVDYR